MLQIRISLPNCTVFLYLCFYLMFFCLNMFLRFVLSPKVTVHKRLQNIDTKILFLAFHARWVWVCFFLFSFTVFLIASKTFFYRVLSFYIMHDFGSKWKVHYFQRSALNKDCSCTLLTLKLIYIVDVSVCFLLFPRSCLLFSLRDVPKCFFFGRNLRLLLLLFWKVRFSFPRY